MGKIIVAKDRQFTQDRETVDRYVARNVGYVDPYGGYGVAERGEKLGEQCAEALGRLVQILTDRGLFDAKEIQLIAKAYVSDPDATLE